MTSIHVPTLVYEMIFFGKRVAGPPLNKGPQMGCTLGSYLNTALVIKGILTTL
jgi:hypothetical protein